jgi:hypothetical protein
VDASLIAADANKQRSIPGSEWQKTRDPETASRAEKEYLATAVKSTSPRNVGFTPRNPTCAYAFHRTLKSAIAASRVAAYPRSCGGSASLGGRRKPANRIHDRRRVIVMAITAPLSAVAYPSGTVLLLPKPKTPTSPPGSPPHLPGGVLWRPHLRPSNPPTMVRSFQFGMTSAPRWPQSWQRIRRPSEGTNTSSSQASTLTTAS